MLANDVYRKNTAAITDFCRKVAAHSEGLCRSSAAAPNDSANDFCRRNSAPYEWAPPQNYRNGKRYFNEGPTMKSGQQMLIAKMLRVCRWHCISCAALVKVVPPSPAASLTMLAPPGKLRLLGNTKRIFEACRLCHDQPKPFAGTCEIVRIVAMNKA